MSTSEKRAIVRTEIDSATGKWAVQTGGPGAWKTVESFPTRAAAEQLAMQLAENLNTEPKGRIWFNDRTDERVSRVEAAPVIVREPAEAVDEQVADEAPPADTGRRRRQAL